MSSICTVQLKVNSKNDRQGAKNMVSTSKTSYFVCGTSVSLCLLIQRTSKHLGHNSSAHFSGQVMQHACSFSSFQLAQRTKSRTRKTRLT